MQERILIGSGPKIDFIFKALLGAEDNRNLLVHFLNAVLSHEVGA